ncbi:hypothetical protein A3SI_06644 [Nitritalea halalkaliphila LW7]|uniref:Group 1 glycosyl transferase n=1 Tax=Nitritalea halalkaliphila LW7 TaxID=1189621 RepID=I5C5Z2_9BACT|nr:hypothetical protein [Nitritalea halalkaliphila]EIM77244.1 hypothetical protein A3SI_06644 [Nitritalea halalkaliphila LW7]
MELVIATYIEHGAKLHWYQHGAYYGELNHGAQVRERRIADVYRTWGWKIEPKDEPWKAYRLMRFQQDYAKQQKSNRYPLLIVFGVINSAYTDTEFFTAYFKVFDQKIDKNKYPVIAARPRPFSRLFSNQKEVEFLKRYAYFTICSDLEPITQNIAESELIFQISVPATNFLECLAVKKPVVGILSNDQETEIVKPFYAFCKEKKILHDSLESVLAHINHLDVSSWWQEVVSDPRYHEFEKRFFNT